MSDVVRFFYFLYLLKGHLFMTTTPRIDRDHGYGIIEGMENGGMNDKFLLFCYGKNTKVD